MANLDGSLVPKGLDEIFYWLPSFIPGETLKDTSALAATIEKRRRDLSIKAQRAKKKAEVDGAMLLSGTSIYLIHPFGWYAYGHLHDSLQRLFNLRGETDIGHTWKYLVSRHDRISDFKDHFQALACAPYEHTKEVEANKIYFCETLYIPMSPAVPTTFTIDSYNWLVESYLGYFGLLSPGSVADNKRTRLYLSRNHVTPGKRSVLNESSLIDRLTTDHGFTVVTGNESLREIIGLFSSASFITGAHGSLFANSIFCRRQCTALEFCPGNRIDKSFEYKVKALKTYVHIAIDADENHNISIPIQEIISRL